MKKLFFLAFLSVFSLNARISSVFAQESITAVGQCHGVTFPNINVSWAYPSGEVFWKDLVPQRGQYNWVELDAAVETANKSGKKIWIQVLTDNPGVQTIPDWALAAGVRQLPDRYDPGKYNKDKPVQWDPLYLQFLQEVLTAMAQRYDNNPTVEAILMMSGGHYGEMALHPQKYHWDENPDIYNPQSPYVIEMARVVGESPEVFVQARSYKGYISKFDYYYVENTKKLIDMYVSTFTKPVVLQVGGGLSGDSYRVAGNAVEYATDKYGNRVWLKQNGWGSWGASDYYNTLFSQYKNKTRITREVGQPATFQTRTAADNIATVNAVISAGTSAICFQSEFFRDTASYPGIDFNQIRTQLEGNYRNLYLPIVGLGCQKSNGDTNKDGQVNSSDYQIWKNEFLSGEVGRTDFNCDYKVSLLDFEIWRSNS